MIYSFDRVLACKIGVDEAIMVFNITYWIEKNAVNKKHYYEGRYWTYNTAEAFQKLFPFWTIKQLRRIMQSLYDQGVVIKGNFNKTSFDRTGWYALSDAFIYLLGTIEVPERANGTPENAQTIPDSNTDNFLPEGKKNTRAPRKKPEKKEFIPPTPQQVEDYFSANGYTKEAAKRAFSYYDCADWHDGEGKKVNSWKQKMISVWFKEENKAKDINQNKQKIVV